MKRKELERKWHNFRNNIGYCVIRGDKTAQERLQSEFKAFCETHKMPYPTYK